jgi:phage tail sheath protein FI
MREKLQIIADAINGFVPPVGNSWRWRAEVWNYRLAILPTDAAADNFLSPGFAFTTAAPALAAFTNNVHLYSVGAGGVSVGFQTSPGLAASDGTPPVLADYRAAFLRIEKDVDLFNLMVLAPDAAIPIEQVYGEASVFCQEQRAFLLMDPPTAAGQTWDDAQDAATSVPALRVGLVRDYSAVFYPRITINDNGLKRNIGASGALAGLFARTDSTRGVWKAPAGTEADFRGIIGLEQLLSDRENGILNPRAINALRVFPSGIVNWGARTNMGDDDTPHDYKYIPIRRLALFIEESLFRGLKWVVFEPNDEPLWAQIRLNVGAFMHNLFRQGAFQGATPRLAYFVKCDSETTPQNDRNLGIVNIWVGFAPLKPAEFVVLYLQQMAGQIET